jgi:hypothetical protein
MTPWGQDSTTEDSGEDAKKAEDEGWKVVVRIGLPLDHGTSLPAS